MLVELANSYIEALNSGEVPNIENAWTNVCTFEQERAYKESLKFFDEAVTAKIKKCYQDIGFENVKNLLLAIREETLQHLRSKMLGDAKASEVIEKKLKLELKGLS